MASRADGGAVADAAEDGFLAVGGNAGAAYLGELLEEVGAIGDGVIGAAREAVGFEDLLGQGALLKGGDGLAHGAAVGRQHAADAVGHADLVEGLDRIEHVDAVFVEVGHARGFIEVMGETFQLGAHCVAQPIGLLDEPAEAEARRKLIGAVDGLLEIAVLLQREQDAEESGFRQAGLRANVFEGEGGFAVEGVEHVEGAADGAEVVLLAGGSVCGGLEGPLGDAAADGFGGFCRGFGLALHERCCLSRGAALLCAAQTRRTHPFLSVLWGASIYTGAKTVCAITFTFAGLV